MPHRIYFPHSSSSYRFILTTFFFCRYRQIAETLLVRIYIEPLQLIDCFGDCHALYTFGGAMDCNDTRKHNQQDYNSNSAKRDVPATAKMSDDDFDINQIVE